VREARLLAAGTPAPHSVSDDRIIVEVPGVELVEAVCLTWSDA
jgi:hypothetical protein